MSFLDSLKNFVDPIKKEAAEGEDEAKYSDLAEANAGLIENLNKVQNERLSAPPPAHFSHIPPPNDKEMELANSLRSNLVKMAKQMKPVEIMPETNSRLTMEVRAPPSS